MCEFFVVPRSDIGQEAWDEFVNNSSECWMWHLYHLQEALSTWKNYTDCSFAIRNKKEILGILPLQMVSEKKISGTIQINSFSSLGWWATKPGIEIATFKRLSDFFNETLNKHISDYKISDIRMQLSPLSPFLHTGESIKINPLLKCGFEDASGITRLIDLNKPIDDIRKSYRDTARWIVSKNSKENCEIVEASTPKDLDTYFQLHMETYKRTGVEPHTFEYFKCIFEKFIPRGLSRILFFQNNGKTVAAQNTALYKKGAYYWTGASSTEKNGNENYILMDNQIENAKNSGASFYELGEAFINPKDPKLEGLNRFKRSFGGDLYPFYKGKKYYSKQYKILRFIKDEVLK
jgi:hypothetical protein